VLKHASVKYMKEREREREREREVYAINIHVQ
jgi:hypothetical protein